MGIYGAEDHNVNTGNKKGWERTGLQWITNGDKLLLKAAGLGKV